MPPCANTSDARMPRTDGAAIPAPHIPRCHGEGDGDAAADDERHRDQNRVKIRRKRLCMRPGQRVAEPRTFLITGFLSASRSSLRRKLLMCVSMLRS